MSENPTKKTEIFIHVVIVVVVAMFIFLIIGSYICNFGAYNQSDDPDRWGVFGDYIGGTMNTLFGLANLVVLTFLTLQIVKIEDERNKNNFNNNIFPVLIYHYLMAFDNFDLRIESCGLGPCVIKKAYIISSQGKEYNSFKDLIMSHNLEDLLIFEATVPKGLTLTINSNVSLFKTNARSDVSNGLEDRYEILLEMISIINKSKIHITYTDILNNKEYVEEDDVDLDEYILHLKDNLKNLNS